MFDLLQIKSHLRSSAINSIVERDQELSKSSLSPQPKDDRSNALPSVPSSNGKHKLAFDHNSVIVKKENLKNEHQDDEKEEGEIVEEEDEDLDTEVDEELECGRVRQRRRSSSNPVNLTINNTNNSSSEHSSSNKETTDNEVSTSLTNPNS